MLYTYTHGKYTFGNAGSTDNPPLLGVVLHHSSFELWVLARQAALARAHHPHCHNGIEVRRD